MVDMLARLLLLAGESVERWDEGFA